MTTTTTPTTERTTAYLMAVARSARNVMHTRLSDSPDDAQTIFDEINESVTEVCRLVGGVYEFRLQRFDNEEYVVCSADEATMCSLYKRDEQGCWMWESDEAPDMEQAVLVLRERLRGAFLPA